MSHDQAIGHLVAEGAIRWLSYQVDLEFMAESWRLFRRTERGRTRAWLEAKVSGRWITPREYAMRLLAGSDPASGAL